MPLPMSLLGPCSVKPLHQPSLNNINGVDFGAYIHLIEQMGLFDYLAENY